MQVFVSRPTWVLNEFEEGLKFFITLIESMGLEPRTLGVTDYPSKSPMDEVIEIMESCKGAVILGYPQLDVTMGSLKGNPVNDLVLATEWNHLEAGLAYAAGLPLLVLHHTNVSRGIFDRGVLNAFLHSVDFGVPHWSMLPAINGAINKWKQQCISGTPSYSGLKKPKDAIIGKPTCPNCSVGTKVIYLSPIPSPFNEFAGGEWECSVCKYVE